MYGENSFILNDNFGDGEIDDWRSAHSDIYELIESLTGPGQLHLLHQVKVRFCQKVPFFCHISKQTNILLAELENLNFGDF